MISAVVLTKNEEKNIVDCIESLSFCDEVIVIDDNSEDRTVELAKREEAKVFTKDLNEDFAAQRNFGLTCAKGDWVLFVDADERVTPQLVSSIKYQVLSKAFAHETEEVHQEPMASESAQASESGRLIGDEWSSQQCKDLQKKLSDLANEKRLWKLIVVPRPTLDVPIALTAWGRIDKLDKFTGEEIGRFIDAFRNHGPEATPD